MGDTLVSTPTNREIAYEKEWAEDRLAKAWALYEDAVWRIARDAQKRILNQFLDANPDMGFRLTSEGERYGLFRDGLPWYKGEEASDIFDLLEVRVEGYEDALATWMMDYPPRGANDRK